jgi:hypothetical protein
MGGGGVLPCQTENRVHRTRYRSGVEGIGMGRFESLWGEEEVVVVVVECQEPENEWGRGIDPKNPNIKHAGSILVVGTKRLAERVEVTCGMGWMCLLMGWVVGNPRTSGAGD